MHAMIRHCVRVDGTESDHTYAQYATPALNSCPADTIYVCEGRRTNVFGVLRIIQLLLPHLFSSDGVAPRAVTLRTSNITKHVCCL